MSLYNMLCGFNPATYRLLDMLSIDIAEIPRFRDVYIDKDFDQIIITTRTGGGNRSCHIVENKLLQDHPQYIQDWDDDFDNTFAYFSFHVTAEEKEKLMNEIKEGCQSQKEIDRAIAIISETPQEKINKVMKAMEKKS